MVHAKKFANQKQIYLEMNSFAERGGVVFFGSTYLSELPLCELTSAFGMNEKVYNRSIANIRIEDTIELLDACVLDLFPRKVFINIGEIDCEDVLFDISDFFSKYEWMLYTIHNKINPQIYIVPIYSQTVTARKINAGLKHLAEECGAEFIDIAPAYTDELPDIRFFNKLKCHIRCSPIGLTEVLATY